VTSLFLNGIFGGGCALAPDFNTLLILRILQGIGSAPGMNVAGTIIGDIFTGQRRAEAMSINTTVMYFGYIIYPVIGGALAGLSWNYSFLPFFIAIPLGFTALFFLNCPEPQSKQSLKDYLRDALRYIKSQKALWLFSATILTYVLLYGGYLVYFGLLLGSRFHASPFTIGLFISILGIITAAASLHVGRLSKKFSVVSLIIGAFALYALAMAITPAMPNLWFCLVPTFFFAIAHGINLPSQRIIAAGVAPLEYRASFMSVQGTMIMLGMTIGPSIMGFVYSYTSLNTTFLVAVPIALIAPIIAMIIGIERLSTT
jgi:ACDE family multidrug resistance protein